MPKIQDYQLQSQVPGPVNQPAARPGIAGSGLASFGDTVADVGNGISAYVQQKQTYESHKLAAQATNDWQTKLIEAQQSAPLGAPDFTKNLQENFDEWMPNYLSQVQGGAARKTLEISLLNLRNQLQQQAYKFESQKRGQQESIDTQRIFDANDNLVYANPNIRDQTIESEKAFIGSSPFWSESERSAMFERRRTALYDKALESRVKTYETNSLATPDQVQKFIDTLKSNPPQKTPKGQVTPGNIDLTNRPRVKNPDGTTSTVRSIGVGFGEGSNAREVLLPTVSDSGKNLTKEEAIDQFKKTGKHLGIFSDKQSAIDYGQQLSRQQADQLKGQSGSPAYRASSDKYQSAIGRLQALKKHLEMSDENQTYIDFEDHMKQIEQTGIDNGSYTKEWIESNVKKAPKRAQMIDRQEKARAVGKEINYIKDRPDFEVMQHIAQMENDFKALPPTNKPGKDRLALEAAKQAFAQRQTQFKEDPVGYILSTSDLVKSSHDEYVKSPTPENAAKYAKDVITQQRFLSPGSIPRLLSKQDVNLVASQMKQIETDPNGASRATSLLQDLIQKWGPTYWPKVVYDLRQGKALKDDQYVAATMYDRPEVRHIAEELVKQSLIKPDDLHHAVADKIKVKEAQDEAKKALQNLRESMASSGVQNTVNAFSIYTAFENTLAQNLLLKKFWGKDSMGSEATKMAHAIILDKYEFQDGYRIPKPYNPSAIREGVRTSKFLLPIMDFVLPADLAGRTEADKKKTYIRRLRDSGRFITDGEEAGLRFVDGNGRPVRIYQDGKAVPLKYTWSELETMKFSDALLKAHEKELDKQYERPAK